MTDERAPSPIHDRCADGGVGEVGAEAIAGADRCGGH